MRKKEDEKLIMINCIVNISYFVYNENKKMVWGFIVFNTHINTS